MKTGTKRISKEEAKIRAAKLRREIERHNYLYYVESNPEISDAEYDVLVDELKIFEGLYPELITLDSPTQRVSGYVAEGFNLVEHRVPMMSIDNISTEGDALEFDKRVKRFLGIEVSQKPRHVGTLRDLTDGIGYTAEPKFDGVSASLTFENGLFIQGATRGDGM